MSTLTRRSLCAGLGLAPLAMWGSSVRAEEEDPWSALDRVAEGTIQAGNTPGVVFLVGHRGKVVYKKAFGNRSLKPDVRPMTVDTVFDMASLTKVVATTSCAMALIEEGRLRPGDLVTQYWPEFGQNGKQEVTIRHLLTHTSGLASYINFYNRFGDKTKSVQDVREAIMNAIAQVAPANPLGSKMVYSDLGYISLGEVVRRVSGKPLDVYARERIFAPLRMRETTYNPQGELKERAAPTTMRAGAWIQGEVHDENAASQSGVSGHAGLFSTADDLSKFARMLLSSDGEGGRRYPLSPATVRLMTSPQTPSGLPVRGYGWDIDSSYSRVRGDLLPVGSFGHTGFTGTYLWVDPFSRSYIIGLSNRVHPDGKGNVLGMWARAANIVAGIVRPQNLPPRAGVADIPQGGAK